MTDKQKDILKKIIIGELLIAFAIALDYFIVYLCVKAIMALTGMVFSWKTAMIVWLCIILLRLELKPNDK